MKIRANAPLEALRILPKNDVTAAGTFERFQDKNRAIGMTERKEAARETNGEPSTAPKLIPAKVNAQDVLEGFACDSQCRKFELPEEPRLTLPVRNDRNLFLSLARAILQVLSS